MHTIRTATISDLTAIQDITNHNILYSTAIYDYNVKTGIEIDKWFTDKQNDKWPVLVAEENGNILGYATYGTFRFKAGFNPTVEHSVYVAEAAQGKGIGRSLLSHLIETARSSGYHCMIGCIDGSNGSSIAFHKKFGFTEAGVLKEVAYKFDRWLDLTFMQLILQ